MRIQRYNSQLSFRHRRRRRSGCLSSAMLLLILAGIGTISWNWIQTRFGVGLAAPSLRTAGDNRIIAALQAFDRGDLDTAIATARDILALEPDRVDAMIVLARSLIYRSYSDYNRMVDRETALEITSAAVNRMPGNPDLQTIHAFVLAANGSPATAAETAQKVLEAQPENELARVALALAYGSVGSHEVALRESQRATQGTHWRLDAHRALAISQSDVGDYRSAIRSVDEALQVNAHLIPLYFEKALYALQVGDADMATNAYYQVLTLDPDNVKARFRLCELSSTMRERNSAIRYCTEVTELAPSWSDGWYQLGREYFLQGNFQAAQTHLHRCSTLQVMQSVPVDERRFECWYLQGQAAEILGDCPGLLATYNEFRAMTKNSSVEQTWTYPPEGPLVCN